jgi:hypothetical protein
MGVDSHNAGFTKPDPASAHVYDRVRGAEVNGDVIATDAGQMHDRVLSGLLNR